jgi:hypothetical protein
VGVPGGRGHNPDNAPGNTPPTPRSGDPIPELQPTPIDSKKFGVPLDRPPLHQRRPLKPSTTNGRQHGHLSQREPPSRNPHVVQRVITLNGRRLRQPGQPLNLLRREPPDKPNVNTPRQIGKPLGAPKMVQHNKRTHGSHGKPSHPGKPPPAHTR